MKRINYILNILCAISIICTHIPLNAQTPAPPQIDTPLTVPHYYFYNAPLTVPYSNGEVGIFNHASVEIHSTTEVTLLPGFTASTDSGCGEFTAGIRECPVITINSTLTHVKCKGMDNGKIEVEVSGGNAPYFYSWSNRTHGNHINDRLISGIYHLLVIDQNGCEDTGIYVIEEPDSLVIQAITSASDCHLSNGTSLIIAQGGNGDYRYNWIEDGSTSPERNDLAAGLHEVLVNDRLGCSREHLVAISDANGPQPNIQLTSTITCHGLNNASILITLPNGGPEPEIPFCNFPNRLSAGNHPVITEDTLGCKTVSIVTVTEPEPILIHAISTPSACGLSVGNIQVSVTGGTGSYSYTWAHGPTTGSVSGLKSGEYTLLVSDENGCTSTSVVNIIDSIGIEASATTEDVSCFNGSDGSILLNITQGAAPFSVYYADGTVTSNPLVNLVAGTYLLYVKDSNECITRVTADLQQPESYTFIADIIPPSGFSEFDGSVTLFPSGGTPPYFYTWNNGSTSSSQYGLGTGSYIVSVRDDKNCTLTDTLELLPVMPDSLNPFRTSNRLKNYSFATYCPNCCPSPSQTVLNIVTDFGAVPNDQNSDHQAFECANAFIVANYCPSGTPVTLEIPAGHYIVGSQNLHQGGFYLKGNHVLEFNDCANVTIKGIPDMNGNPPVIKYQNCLRYGAFEHRQGPNYGLRYLNPRGCCRYDEVPVYNNCVTVRDPNTNAVTKGCGVNPRVDCYCLPFGTWQDYAFGAYPGNFLNLDNCHNFIVENLEINGNVDMASIGGQFASDGSGIQQLPYTGMFLWDSWKIDIRNVNVHHFGMDGIHISNQTHPQAMNLRIFESKFNWNCRSGMSWISGSGVQVINSEFNYNGYGPWGGSATRNGVDIEYEGFADLAEGYFKRCDFKYNAAAGVMSDAGRYQNSQQAPYSDEHTYNFTFDRCTFVSGGTNSANGVAVWPNARNFKFICSNFYGTLVRPFNASLTNTNNLDWATKFIKCTFNEEYEDPEVGIKYAFTHDKQSSCHNGPYFEHPYLINFGSAANRALFDRCKINTNYYNKWGIFNGGARPSPNVPVNLNYVIIRNTDFTSTGLETVTPNGSLDANRILASFTNVDLSVGNRVFIPHNHSNCKCPDPTGNYHLYCWQVNNCSVNNVIGTLNMMRVNGGYPCFNCNSGTFPQPDGFTDAAYTYPPPCSPKWPGVPGSNLSMYGDCDPPGCTRYWEPLLCNSCLPPCSEIPPNNNRKKEHEIKNSVDWSLAISPVPSQDIITVSNYVQGEELVIRNMLGEMVLFIPTGNSETKTQISISSLLPGVYFIESRHRISGKFIRY
jgi:hypothetical protein